MPSHTPAEKAKRASEAAAGQSGGQPDGQGDLGSFILKAPEDLWQQIKSALQVQTRQQAAEIVATDPEAQRIVTQILTGDGAQSLSPRRAPALAGSSRQSSLAGSRRPTSSGGAARAEF